MVLLLNCGSLGELVYIVRIVVIWTMYNMVVKIVIIWNDFVYLVGSFVMFGLFVLYLLVLDPFGITGLSTFVVRFGGSSLKYIYFFKFNLQVRVFEKVEIILKTCFTVKILRWGALPLKILILLYFEILKVGVRYC